MRHWLSPLLYSRCSSAARWPTRVMSQKVWTAGARAWKPLLPPPRRRTGRGRAKRLGAVYASWDARQTYFHIMVEHAELDAAEALFAVSHSFAESEDGAEFRANTAELLTQLRLLNEMEEISIKNIL